MRRFANFLKRKKDFFAYTNYNEIGSYRERLADGSAPLWIIWECKNCGKRIELPERQDFCFCIHCGKRVLTRVIAAASPLL